MRWTMGSSWSSTKLLDDDLLRRDQIWFVDKDDRQASRLYPLTDFSPRKGEALEKGYLRARYGGVPSDQRCRRGGQATTNVFRR